MEKNNKIKKKVKSEGRKKERGATKRMGLGHRKPSTQTETKEILRKKNINV